MKILVDMNLSPDWVGLLNSQGFASVHWSTKGDPRAEDSVIMEWARHNGYVVLTHDLDFGAALALSQKSGPSVMLIRAHDVTPQHLSKAVLAVLAQNASLLETGALIVLDEVRTRIRILPL